MKIDKDNISKLFKKNDHSAFIFMRSWSYHDLIEIHWSAFFNVVVIVVVAISGVGVVRVGA